MGSFASTESLKLSDLKPPLLWKAFRLHDPALLAAEQKARISIRKSSPKTKLERY
jgi:hypothetical protein